MQDFVRLHHRHSTSISKKALTLLLFYSLVLIFFIIVISLSFLQTPQPTQIISPLASPLKETKAVLAETITRPEFSEIITRTFKNTQGRYAIVIKNLQYGETYMQNEHEVFTTASLYKLWLMATAYHQIEQGSIRHNSPMKKDAAELNRIFRIATESAGITQGTLSMKVDEAIHKSITISDNYSALLLTSLVRVSRMAEFLKTNGFNESKVGDTPQTTAYDIAVFFEKLYQKRLVSPQADEEMLTLLKQQQLNDRIPKYLPPYTPIAHKTGELDGYKHDAGIVFMPKGDYIIVVLSETENPATAAENIARFSQEVHTYFQDPL